MDEDILSIIAEESGERIDALLARTVTGLSRSAAQRLIEKGAVRIGDRPVQKNTRCEAGIEITVLLPETVGSAAAEQKGQAGSGGPRNPPLDRGTESKIKEISAVSVAELGYNPRPMAQSIAEEIDWMIEEGIVTIPAMSAHTAA